MKAIEFKKIIKTAVREAIQEELRDILLEAVRAPKQAIVHEVVKKTPQPIKENFDSNPSINVRQKYMDLLDDMASGKEEMSFNTQNLNPISMTPRDTISEGSSLPEGEVPLSMIAKFVK